MDEDMSKFEFRIAFDGEALVGHTMNVRDLAPSLLALGEIINEANRILNGPEAKSELHITPNIHEACFDIGVEIKQHWETLKKLFGDDDISTAKNVIEWIFIGGALSFGTIKSLLMVYKMFKKKRPVNIIQFNDADGNRLYRYQFEGAEDQILDQKLHQLYKSDKIRRLLARLLAPILRRDGIESFAAYVKDRATELIVTKEDAREFDYEIQEIDEIPTDTDEPVEAVLRVYSPVYDLKANRWRFWLGKNHHYMDISESGISQFVLNNGGALVEDRFRVMLQATEREDDAGKTVTDYKVLEVLEFIPALRQQDMFLQSISDSEEQEV